MPTPESELFLAKKPKVPPTFEGVDFTNNQQVWDARDAIIREQWVKQMMARLVREELGKCYVREGVNHLANCGKYRGMFHLSIYPAFVKNGLFILLPLCIPYNIHVVTRIG